MRRKQLAKGRAYLRAVRCRCIRFRLSQRVKLFIDAPREIDVHDQLLQQARIGAVKMARWELAGDLPPVLLLLLAQMWRRRQSGRVDRVEGRNLLGRAPGHERISPEGPIRALFILELSGRERGRSFHDPGRNFRPVITNPAETPIQSALLPP